ncbi:hypothetical protein BDF14DRAFT_137044 [Spinellus fusiger]|nr:hypothetical protein BDF14DRAFT_431589 [Spinellus fusiger]KAI7862188.1 hypothetical protein BDF14DRAFT_137044 [Spinellus fusiger]
MVNSPTSQTVWEFGKSHTVEWQIPKGVIIDENASTYLNILHVYPEDLENTDVWSLDSDFDINKGFLKVFIPLFSPGESNYTISLLVDDYNSGTTVIESEQFTIKNLQD